MLSIDGSVQEFISARSGDGGWSRSALEEAERDIRDRLKVWRSETSIVILLSSAMVRSRIDGVSLASAVEAVCDRYLERFVIGLFGRRSS